jgi:hypothetical protein
MGCEEIRERFVEVLYDESGGSPENAELQAHLRTCSACRSELGELKQTRDFLRLWRDESPLRSVATPQRRVSASPAIKWRYLRYAAVAAMAVICLLALANTQVMWNKEGLSFSTSFFPGQKTGKDYYTKNELRDLLRQALDDSESRMNETSFLMMQKLLESIDQDRWMDLRLIRSSVAQNRNKN